MTTTAALKHRNHKASRLVCHDATPSKRFKTFINSSITPQADPELNPQPHPPKTWKRCKSPLSVSVFPECEPGPRRGRFLVSTSSGGEKSRRGQKGSVLSIDKF